MYCRQCGTQNDDDYAACIECGEVFKQFPPEAEKKETDTGKQKKKKQEEGQERKS